MACIAGMVLWDLAGMRENLTADIAATAEVEPWTGAYSTLGLIVWGVMIGALLLGALVTARRNDRRRARFLGVTGGLVGYLAVDDALLLHEDLLPDEVGIPEPAVYLTMLIGTVVWAVVYRDFLLGSDLLLLTLAAGAFGVSLASDVLDLPMSFEDGAKYTGLAGATGWAVAVSLQAIESPARGGPAPDQAEAPVLNAPEIS